MCIRDRIVAVAALTAGLVAYSIIAQKNADDSYGMAAANEKLQESLSLIHIFRSWPASFGR